MERVWPLLVLVILLAWGCANENQPQDIPVLRIDAEGTISQANCSMRGLDGKVLVLESKYCGACRMTVPILEGIEAERGLDFIFLDLAEPKARQQLEQYGIMNTYTPTVIVDCEVYIGHRSKEEFEQIFDRFEG